MDERKRYELLVFLTIYVIFIGLMVPVDLKMPRIFMRYMVTRYGEMERPEPLPADAYARPAARSSSVVVVLAGAGLLALGTYYGTRGYRKLTRRDYRVERGGRAECMDALAHRPNCRHYRPTPSTECAYFLGAGNQGMCVRQATKKPTHRRRHEAPGPRAKA